MGGAKESQGGLDNRYILWKSNSRLKSLWGGGSYKKLVVYFLDVEGILGQKESSRQFGRRTLMIIWRAIRGVIYWCVPGGVKMGERSLPVRVTQKSVMVYYRKSYEMFDKKKEQHKGRKKKQVGLLRCARWKTCGGA